MSGITFTLSMPKWLAQWYAHRCGGGAVLQLPKGSLESTIVQRFSRPKSEASKPDIPMQGDLLIEIPENKAKPARIYSHVPDTAKQMLYKTILECFDLSLFEDIVRPFRQGTLKKDLIYSWMEQNGIDFDETNWFAVEKRFTRLRSRMLSGARVRKSRKKSSE